jgi:hypothetical protein
MKIAAIPTEYRGVRFRSTLEANWAATFDSLDWHWSYEPVAVRVGGHNYLCDFYLPTMRVWCEVKGPHDERLNKTRALHAALEPDPWNSGQPIVVILRPPGPGDVAIWESLDPGQDLIITVCPDCQYHCFMDTEGIWQCRRCYYGNGLTHDNKFWRKEFYRSGELPFVRAPRSAVA